MDMKHGKMEPNLYESEKAHMWEAPRGRRNVGGYERALRLGLGSAATVGAFAAAAPITAGVLAVTGLAGLTTGISGYCPMSRKLGRDTYHRT